MTELKVPKIGNAAGTCNSLTLFEKLLRSAVDTITYGPMTVLTREKNAGNNFYTDAHGRMVNSMGLPSAGIPWYEENWSRMQAAVEAVGKDIALTLPPIDSDDIEKQAETCMKLGVKIVEINAGCSNVWVEGKQKRILAFDPEGINRTLNKWHAIVKGGQMQETRFKLSPYSDPVMLTDVASVFRNHPSVTIVTSNTFANARMFRDHDNLDAIEFGKHLGGYGGRGLKPIALGQVSQFRELLTSHRIIGVGGIEVGRDMWEFMQVGADEIQVGTAWAWTEDTHVFSDILSQYVNITETN